MFKICVSLLSHWQLVQNLVRSQLCCAKVGHIEKRCVVLVTISSDQEAELPTYLCAQMLPNSTLVKQPMGQMPAESMIACPCPQPDQTSRELSNPQTDTRGLLSFEHRTPYSVQWQNPNLSGDAMVRLHPSCGGLHTQGGGGPGATLDWVDSQMSRHKRQTYAFQV